MYRIADGRRERPVGTLSKPRQPRSRLMVCMACTEQSHLPAGGLAIESSNIDHPCTPTTTSGTRGQHPGSSPGRFSECPSAAAHHEQRWRGLIFCLRLWCGVVWGSHTTSAAEASPSVHTLDLRGRARGSNGAHCSTQNKPPPPPHPFRGGERRGHGAGVCWFCLIFIC